MGYKAPLKKWVFNSYQRFHANRTQTGLYSKIRKPKLLFHSTVDEKTKIFPDVINKEKKMKKKQK